MAGQNFNNRGKFSKKNPYIDRRESKSMCIELFSLDFEEAKANNIDRPRN